MDKIYEIVDVYDVDKNFKIKDSLIGLKGKFTFCDPDKFGIVENKGLREGRTIFVFSEPFTFPDGKWSWNIYFDKVKVKSCKR